MLLYIHYFTIVKTWVRRNDFVTNQVIIFKSSAQLTQMAFFLDTYLNKPNLPLNGQMYIPFLCLKEKRVFNLPDTEMILLLESLRDHEKDGFNCGEKILQ